MQAKRDEHKQTEEILEQVRLAAKAALEKIQSELAAEQAELESINGKLQAETTLRKYTEERLEQARLAAEAAAEKFRVEIAERREAEGRLEQTVAERIQELATVNGQLQAETSLRKNTEERLEQARLAAEAAADKFRTELAERREAESRLEQSVAERTQDLAAANLQLQAKRDELKQTEERMEQARLAAEAAAKATAESFETQLAERRQAERALEQRAAERNQELASVKEQLQTEIIGRRDTEERLEHTRDLMEEARVTAEAAAKVAAEKFQAELAERRLAERLLEEKVAERTKELESLNVQLRVETTRRRNSEEALEQAKLASEAAAEKFQTELAERRQAESILEQKVTERNEELATVSGQLQAETTKRKNTEELLEQAMKATEAVVQQLQDELDEHKATEEQLAQSRLEAAAISEKLKAELAERREIESNLEQTKAFSDRLFNASPDTLLLFDPETGKPIRWNKSFAEVSGYDDKEIPLMKAPKDFYEEVLPNGTMPALLDVSTGKKKFAELIMHTKNGTRIPYECGVTVIKTREGKPLLMPVGRDVTGRRTKSAILANMSREIRTETNGIINMNAFLLETALSNEQRNYAQIAHRSGESLLEYINDIVSFSNIEAGILEIVKQDFDFKDLLDEATEILNAKAANTGHELICRVDPGVPAYLKGDQKRLLEVITNIAGNAIEFTSKGRIIISAWVESDMGESIIIRISVKDSGSGKSDERHSALYDPSVLIQGTTSRQYGDASLGLAMSKLLVDLMGGKIGVDTIEGKGTTFWFTAELEKLDPDFAPQITPRIKTSEISGEAVARPTMTDSAKKGIRILLAEDYLTNQQVAIIILNKLGYQADAVINGAEAVAALERTNSDLVLMDCEMPKMDGFEATTLIRSSSSKVFNHSIPIIALTANALDKDREKCLDCGMDDFLTKPVRMEKLAAVLDKWLLPGVTHTQSTLPLFEEKDLMEYLDGDQKYAKKVLNYVLKTFPEHIETLKKLAKGVDLQAVQQQANTMTSLVSCTFTPALQEICTKVEAAAQKSDLEATRGLLPELERTGLMTLEKMRTAAARL